MNDQLALFIDFENIAIWAEQHQFPLDIGELMKTLRGRGSVVIKQAYADWGNFTQYRNALLSNAIDLVQLYSIRESKNRADIRLSLDAFEVAIQRPQIPTIVLVSGDSDFGPLVNKLREYGKYVIGIGPREIAHRLLVSACDEFIYLESTMGAPERPTRHTFADREEARQLMMKALAVHDRRGDIPVLATRLKQTMLSMDPTFSESNLGFSQFRAWLEANHDLIKLFFRDLQLYVAPADFALEGEARPAPLPEKPDARAELMRQYTAIFNRIIFVDLQTRRDVMLDIYCELSASPGKFTSEEVLGRLQARYQAEGKARHQNALLRVWQTGFYQRAYDFYDKPASFKVPVRLAQEIDSAVAFIRRVESGFIYAVMKDGLEVDLSALAEVLLGDSTATEYIKLLFEDVRRRLQGVPAPPQTAAPQTAAPQTADEKAAPQTADEKAAPQTAAPEQAAPQTAAAQKAAPQAAEAVRPAAPDKAAPEQAAPQRAEPQAVEAVRRAAPETTEPPAVPETALTPGEAAKRARYSLFPKFLASPYLHPVMDDIANAPLPSDGPATAGVAARLAQEATEARQARNIGTALMEYLQACRVQAEALQRGDPDATVGDLAWYMAAYTSVRAGELTQNRRDYAGARPYYLAFFYLLRVEPALWSRAEGLIAPMLHHYWANVGREMGLEFAGPAQPARLALEIMDSKNPALRYAWNQANQALSEMNPELLRWVVAKIKEEQETQG